MVDDILTFLKWSVIILVKSQFPHVKDVINALMLWIHFMKYTHSDVATDLLWSYYRYWYINVIELPISFRVTSLALWQSYESEVYGWN